MSNCEEACLKIQDNCGGYVKIVSFKKDDGLMSVVFNVGVLSDGCNETLEEHVKCFAKEYGDAVIKCLKHTNIGLPEYLKNIMCKGVEDEDE